VNKTRSVGYNQRFVTALPDIHFEVLRVLAEGDHVLIHWTGSGTHAERLATVTGETIPPTRRRVRVSGAMLTELRYGKIARGWFYWDELSLLVQLGIPEQPGLFLSPGGFESAENDPTGAKASFGELTPCEFAGTPAFCNVGQPRVHTTS
jgi:predicted ester cyclase